MFIDSIEANVEASGSNVMQGNIQLAQAREHKVSLDLLIFTGLLKPIFNLMIFFLVKCKKEEIFLFYFIDSGNNYSDSCNLLFYQKIKIDFCPTNFHFKFSFNFFQLYFYHLLIFN